MEEFKEKAVKQELIESLGYDKGRLYYLLLTNQEEKIEEKFSHSKKYRLLRELFKKGIVGKTRLDNKDSFRYVLLPPSFLQFKDVEKETIKFLEKIYFKNSSNWIKEEFSQLLLRENKGLLVFLLRYFMDKKAEILVDKDIKDSLGMNGMGKKNKNIRIIRNEKTKRNVGIIDRNIAFEFSNIRNRNYSEYIGYLARG